MTAKHTMTQTQVRALFDCRDGKLFWRVRRPKVVLGAEAGCRAPNGYQMIRANGTLFRAHRLIFLWHHGYLPEEVDHINRDGRDNRIENLRDVSHSRNNLNNGARGTTRLPSGRWRAQLTVQYRQIPIGCFDTEFAAHRAYLREKSRHA
jgi:hypothetical protein